MPRNASVEPTLERHYTQEQLASAVGVHVITIKRACKRGDLAFYRIGRAVRIPQSAVDAWLASQRVGVRS